MKKMMLNPLQPSTFKGLHPTILWEIFERLPIKVLLTCKFVCKEWYKIIVDDEFAEYRRRHSHFSSYLFRGKSDNRRIKFLLLELDKSFDIHHSSFPDERAFQKIGFKFKFKIPHCGFELGNACNGLVPLCTYGRANVFYYICNLLTAEVSIIRQYRKQSSSSSYALGYCCASNQYKLLTIVASENKYVAKIQTLGSKKWRNIEGAPSQLYSGSSLNGNLHWLNYGPKKTGMWSFQFETEQFRSLDLLPPVPDDSNSVALTVFKSCLCICCVTRNSRQNEIWLMKEYGVKESWVKELVIMTDLARSPYYRPVMQMNNGKILISIHGDGKLAFYDPETKTYEDVEVPGLRYIKMVACDAKFSRLPWQRSYSALNGS